MSKDLSRLHKKVQKSFMANFSKPQEIDGIVNFIDINEKIFGIRSSNDNYKMECRTSEDLTKLNVGDEITMKGWLKFHPNIGKVYFTAEYVYVLSEKKKYSTVINTYGKLKNILKNDKYKNVINDFTLRRAPKMIYNVGLICLPNDEENITNFKISFQEKCTGNLFVYQLRNDMLGISLGSIIEYLKKYHLVDIVCLLTNNISGIKSICELSSKTNVSYLISRKENTPFIISVASSNTSNEISEPLTNLLSNITLDGINACVEYIHNIQSSFRIQTKNGIYDGTNILYQLVEQYKKKVLDAKLHISELLDPRFDKLLTALTTSQDSFILIKELLIKRFDREIILLHNKKNNIVKHILDDKRIKCIFQQIMDSEEKKFASLMSARTIGTDITQSQNNPSIIIHRTHEVDATSELKNQNDDNSYAKKIENKSPDIISGDVLSNSIQRKNGDF